MGTEEEGQVRDTPKWEGKHRLVESFVRGNPRHHHQEILEVEEEAGAVQAVGKAETAVVAAAVHELDGVSKLK